MTHIAGVLHWMATSPSEETGKGEEVEGFPLYQEGFDAKGIETIDDEVECSWVRIKGKANQADMLLGVCYHPPSQGEEVGNLFYEHLENVSGSPALVLVGDFNLPESAGNLIQQKSGSPGSF